MTKNKIDKAGLWWKWVNKEAVVLLFFILSKKLTFHQKYKKQSKCSNIVSQVLVKKQNKKVSRERRTVCLMVDFALTRKAWSFCQ